MEFGIISNILFLIKSKLFDIFIIVLFFSKLRINSLDLYRLRIILYIAFRVIPSY